MPSDERSRRQFLKRAGTVALAAGLAGCGSDDDDDRTPTPRPTPDRDETPSPTEAPSETETAPPTPTETSTPVPEIVRRFGDRFGSIVDLAKAGADAAGDQRIDDVLADAVADDTLLYFPSGEYKLGPVRLENCSNMGLVSLPGEDVTVTPAVQAGEMNHRFMEITGASDLLIDGITLDFEGTRRGGAVHVAATDDFVVRNRDFLVLGGVVGADDWPARRLDRDACARARGIVHQFRADDVFAWEEFARACHDSRDVLAKTLALLRRERYCLALPTERGIAIHLVFARNRRRGRFNLTEFTGSAGSRRTSPARPPRRTRLLAPSPFARRPPAR